MNVKTIVARNPSVFDELIAKFDPEYSVVDFKTHVVTAGEGNVLYVAIIRYEVLE